MSKNTICLWYRGDAEAAARFYAATFLNSSVGAVHRAPGDYPDGNAGKVSQAGFYRYLTKPVKVDELAGTLEEILSGPRNTPRE